MAIWNRIAKITGIVLGPLVWFPLLIIAFLFKTDLSEKQQLILFPLIIIFLVLIPFGYLFFMIKKKEIADWDIRNRKERYKILPLFILSNLILFVFVNVFGTKLFFHLFTILLFVALLGTIITYVWKISLHMTVITSSVIILDFLFGFKLPELYILIPIVGWARFYQKHHTILQIVIGTLVSGLITIIGLYYFKYI